MAATRFRSVDEYVRSRPQASWGVLERVRAVIRKALPAAEEVISYQMPAYRLHGRVVVYFAGWKEHYSLYPVTGPAKSAFEKELSRYDTSKGTVRFPLTEPVPAQLITRIAKFLANQAAARKR